MKLILKNQNLKNLQDEKIFIFESGRQIFNIIADLKK